MPFTSSSLPRTAIAFVACIWMLLAAALSQKLQAQTPTDSLVIVDHISYHGNKITKQHIIERELLIQQGDTIPIALFRQNIKASQDNLMNTSLFNIVRVQAVLGAKYNGMYYYMVEVHMQERWYIWPLPIFELAERNFNTWWETKDLSLLNYGLYLNWDNFRGRKEKLSLLLQFGYDEKWGLSYHIPYLNKKKTLGLTLVYSRQKQHAISYITQDNKPLRYRLEKGYIAKRHKAELSLHYRPNIYKSHHVNLGYYQHHFHDTLALLNPSFASQNEIEYMRLSYLFRNDHRNYKIYPLTGYYYTIEVEKKGLGLLQTPINQISLQLDARKYWQLQPRWYAALFFSGRVGAESHHSYFINRGLGYGRYFVRGYEYYVIDGQNYILTKSELRFALFEQTTSTLPIINNPKFNRVPWAVYLSSFIDSGYVPSTPSQGNTLQKELLLGGGVGINIVTYYDMVFRSEFSINKKGETGIFFHFIAPL